MVPSQFMPDECSADEWEKIFDNSEARHYCFSPCCYICSYEFTTDAFDWKSTSLRRSDKAGICTAEELEDLHLFVKRAWWSLFRMSELRTKYQIV